jgi:hypothetical protein
MALEELRKRGAKGGHHVLDADIRDYFGSIDQRKLMLLLEKRISDRRVLKLLRQWLEAGVMEDGVVTIWERSRRRVYFLQRAPSQRSMKRIRQRVKELTPSSRCGADLRDVIGQLNPVLRGWGQYFRNRQRSAALQPARHVRVATSSQLARTAQGRHLRAGELRRWDRDYFHALSTPIGSLGATTPTAGIGRIPRQTPRPAIPVRTTSSAEENP